MKNNEKYAQISWYKLLTALGSDVTNIDINVLQPCPMHPNLAPSLRVKYTEDGLLSFDCNYPHCKFKGDHIQLTAERMHLTSEDAARLFKPNNQLAAAVLDSDTTNYLIEYTNLEINQDIIKHFLSDCHAQLSDSNNPHATLINNFLTGKNWIPASERELPPNVGCLDYNLIPQQLDVLKKNIYKKEPHIIFGLQYGDTLTGFNVYNITNRDTTTYKFLAAPNHIFDLTENSNTDTLYIVPDELYALAINLKSKMYANKPLATLAMTNGILPKIYSRFDRVKLIDTKDHPLTVSKALDIFKHESIIEDSLEVKNIVVSSMSKELTKVSLSVFLASCANNRATSLVTWIAKELLAIANSDVTANIFETLYTHKLPSKQFEALLSKLSKQGASKEFIEELTDYNFKVHNDLFINNRYIVRKSKYGLHGISSNGNKTLLSNTVIDIHRKFMTNKIPDALTRCNNVLCDCTFSLDGYKVDALVPYDAFINRIALKNCINKAFMDKGIAPKVTVSAPPTHSFNWDEIRDALTESHIVEKEVNTLGFTDTNTVDFPSCRISKEITPQRHIYTFNPVVIDMYKGININEGDTSIEPIKTLFSQDNPASMIMTAAISHFVHCLMKGFQILSGATFAPDHLLLAYSDDNNMEEIFKQIVLMMSNTLYQDRLPYAQPRKFLQEIKELGTLPFITKLPEYALQHKATLLRESPVNIISTIPEEDCGRLTDIKNMSFITGSADSIYDNKSIIALQQALPCLLHRLLHSNTIKTEKFIGTTVIPALSTYKKLCEFMEIAPKAMETVLKPYYTPTHIELEKLFIRDLQTLIKENSLRIMYVDERSPATPSIIQISTHNNEVYMPTLVIAAINQILLRNYRVSAVKYHLDAAGVIKASDGRFWTIPLPIWEEKFSAAINVPENKSYPPLKLMALIS